MAANTTRRRRSNPDRQAMQIAARDGKPRLFAGVYPGGIVYSDRDREENGDYKRVAFLPYDTLELRVDDPDSPLLDEVRQDAATIQAQRGQPFRTSATGQTIILG